MPLYMCNLKGGELDYVCTSPKTLDALVVSYGLIDILRHQKDS